jgi:phosphoglycerate dehydrogenase-like enzyme
VIVLCEFAPALEPIRVRFPELEVIDVSEGVTPGLRGDVLFGGMGPHAADIMATGIQWVHVGGTGIDTIDPAVRAAPLLTTSRGSSAVPISEYVIAAMAAFARHLPQNWIHEPPEQWHRQPSGKLAGATLGLFGFGGIAQRIARIALAMDMTVVAQRRSEGASPIESVEVVRSFGELVSEADHLVLVAPATELTYHVINADSLTLVKPGLHLINVARGSLVDHDALREALDDGRIARASLDVTDPEPVPEGHWLYEHPRVFLTPHSSWVGPPLFEAAVELFCKNLERYLAGAPLVGVVGDGGY